jgi:hypothetical protein
MRPDRAGGERAGAGPAPPASRRALRLAGAAAATLLGLGALRLLGGVGQPGSEPDLAAPDEPPPTAAAATTTTARQRADARIEGRLPADLAGTLLYFGGQRPRVADLGARTVADVVPQPRGAPALVIRQGADPVLLHGEGVLVLPNRPGAGSARRLPAVVARGSPPDAALVEYLVLQAAGGEEIYVMGFDTATPGRLTLRRVPLGGGPPRAVAVLPEGVEAVAMVDGGALLRTPGGDLELASLPDLRRLAGFGRARLLDTDGRRVALVDERGDLRLYDVATRSGRVVRQPPEVFRWEAFIGGNDTCCQQQAAFSPDGRTLAVLATMDRGTLIGIALVDTATLGTTVVDGSVGPFPTGCLPCLSWRPDGRWLFFMTAQQSFTVVGAWRRGDPAAVRIVARLATDSSPTGLVAAGG